jgi:hypothetical protein
VTGHGVYECVRGRFQIGEKSREKRIDPGPSSDYFSFTEQDPNHGSPPSSSATSARRSLLIRWQRFTMAHLNRLPAMIRATVREPGARKAPSVLMRIRELDPRSKCGTGTTVMQLFRVDDLPEDSPRVHLVFHDRHGWYCEHGRDCPAVAAVRRHQRLDSLDS